MKRFHVHLGVNDLAQSITFYTTLFGVEPAVRKDDYAKWMIEDPRINFAISARGLPAGVDHVGLQVDTAEELGEIETRLQQAEQTMVTQANAACCYALSNKHWVTDPQGVAWETYHTLDQIPVFGEDTKVKAGAESACCAPAPIGLTGLARKTVEKSGCGG
ncbi:MAG: ArsI/CadI family heavy metal resistance metalloenzyme [Blastocatellia bacterium]